ncbi:hypothetical protein NDU88_003123 [Pleurodeles waltl]|uniref:Uncharacterized protein n=1 Tax=Pleurodeles waltl TaxID=8319 RepID=A0AAV7NFI6_PLEWA|nr:hypothetical protein NDU88_003123 [Pleurodeles waltl]
MGLDDGQSGLLPVEEPSQVEILAAIQGSRVALEGKIETVVVEVNLLRADLRKVSDKVKVAEGSIVELQLEVLSGGRSHFFEQPEKFWRWLEMWDKRALGKPTGARRVVNRASGADGSDWRKREGERTADSMDQGVVEVPAPRV